MKQEFDPGWCVLAGCDPMEWLRAHPRRNPCVHVMPAIADAAGLMPGQCGVGSARDRAEWSRILPALAADGTQWLVVKPTVHPGSIKDLKSSYEHLKGIA